MSAVIYLTRERGEEETPKDALFQHTKGKKSFSANFTGVRHFVGLLSRVCLTHPSGEERSKRRPAVYVLLILFSLLFYCLFRLLPPLRKVFPFSQIRFAENEIFPPSFFPKGWKSSF